MEVGARRTDVDRDVGRQGEQDAGADEEVASIRDARSTKEQHPNADGQNHHSEHPRKRPGKRDEVRCFGGAIKQANCGERVKRIHRTCREQCHADDRRREVACDSKVYERQKRRGQGGTEGGPFQERMREASREGTMHGIDGWGGASRQARR